jgi:mono/diheme cytochrome c family protein
MEIAGETGILPARHRKVKIAGLRSLAFRAAAPVQCLPFLSTLRGFVPNRRCTMRRFSFVAATVVAAMLTLGQPDAPDPSLVPDNPPAGGSAGSEADQPSPIERGRYITHHVAMCVECHTPRDGDGNLIPSRLFKGATIPVTNPPYPNIDWAFQAPDIAGLVGYDDAAEMLMTGIVTRTGKPPLRPMPSFQMNQEDAEAVVAYLKSLR